MSMTPKQERFVEEYLVDLNASAAATRAGYSERTAYSIGERLLRNVEVAAAIEQGLAARATRTEISAEYVLASLVEIIEARKAGDGSVTASAAVRALELIGRHIGMFSDKLRVEHSGEVNLRAEIRAAALEAFAGRKQA